MNNTETETVDEIAGGLYDGIEEMTERAQEEAERNRAFESSVLLGSPSAGAARVDRVPYVSASGALDPAPEVFGSEETRELVGDAVTPGSTYEAAPNDDDLRRALNEQAALRAREEGQREQNENLLFPELSEPSKPAPIIAEEDFTTLGKKVESATVCLELKISGCSFSRKVKPESVVKAKEGPVIEKIEKEQGVGPGKCDPKMLRVSKDLIDRTATRPISVLESRLKDYLLLRKVECRMLRGGMYLIPVGLVSDVERAIKDFTKARAVEVEKFLDKYTELKKNARESLGEIYNESDYPTPAQIRDAYSAEYRWLSFNVSAALKSVSSELFERERRKSEAQWAEAAEDIRVALREGMATMVNHMFEALGQNDDGKPKTFHSSMVEKMKTFLATFEARNLTDDSELQAMAERARNLLDGIGAEDLRKNQAVRDNVRGQLETLKTEMATLVATRTRKIDLEGLE